MIGTRKGVNWFGALLLAGLLACGARPEPAAEASYVAAEPTLPSKWWQPKPPGAFVRVETHATGEQRWKRARPTAPRFFTGISGGYRRYRGTLGGQAITVEFMTTEAPDTVDGWSRNGRYFADRGGKPYTLLLPEKWRRAAPLRLIETTGEYDEDATAHTAEWQAQQPLGPMLSGQRVDRYTGRTQPFRLEENYAGAIRYEIICESGKNDTTWWDFGDGEILHRYKYVDKQYLHLLGPDTLLPAIAKLQCPNAQRRRETLQADLMTLSEQNDEQEGTRGLIGYVDVELNELGLVVIHSNDQNDMGAAYPSDSDEFRVYDLATGKSHHVNEWFRPEKTLALRRLVTRKALAQQPSSIGMSIREELNRAPFTLEHTPDFGLDTQGIYFFMAEFGAPHVSAHTPVHISFAELNPYVRRGTPLARLVAAHARVH